VRVHPPLRGHTGPAPGAHPTHTGRTATSSRKTDRERGPYSDDRHLLRPLVPPESRHESRHGGAISGSRVRIPPDRATVATRNVAKSTRNVADRLCGQLRPAPGRERDPARNFLSATVAHRRSATHRSGQRNCPSLAELNVPGQPGGRSCAYRQSWQILPGVRFDHAGGFPPAGRARAAWSTPLCVKLGTLSLQQTSVCPELWVSTGHV
jgi:hypothetical protein